MDWHSLVGCMKLADKDMPERSATIRALTAVLNGEQYDCLPHDFGEEKTTNGEYIPLARRRPSVRTNLCSVVVEDSVSLLFGDEHFPQIVCDDKPTAQAFADLVKFRALNQVMIDAATRGSVGSIAILLRVLQSKPFFTVMQTAFLAPKWKAKDPDALETVTEKYKVDPQDLIALGYAVKIDDGKYWFMRRWTETREEWYIPWRTSDANSVPQIDTSRTVEHRLGFVPILWVRNLTGGDDVDGACTFRRGIDSVIELDYLLSQAGRGLKYASDPTLVLKTEGASGGPTHAGGAAQALVLPIEGDAKLLEINGNAANAVLEQARELRSTSLELMHGNRAHGDRLTAAQSGRAMEMMNRGLIGLASNLRVSYGEGALLSLMRMVCDVCRRMKGIEIGGKKIASLDSSGLHLRWPPWYPPTHEDMEAQSNALKTALDAGVISRETAVFKIAPNYDIEDVPSELVKIKQDMDDAEAREIRVQAAVQVKETAPA